MKKYLIFITLLISAGLFSTTINIPADYSTIQDGVNASSDGDTVRVAPGTYTGQIDFSGKNITVASEYAFDYDLGHIDQTIIDANWNGRVVTFNNGETNTAMLIGFTIQNGDTQTNGGGILCDGASPKLMNLVVKDCAGNHGGGISLENSNSELLNIKLTMNYSTDDGAAIYVGNNSNVSLKNILAYSNDGSGAPGIAFENSAGSVINSTVTGNFVMFGSGAGGVNCSGSSDVVIFNSIIYGNSAPQIVNSQNLWVYYSCYEGSITSNTGATLDELNTITSDPSFVDPNNSDYHLTQNSPCVDAGIRQTFLNNTNIRATVSDIENVPRSMMSNNEYDFGAYEYSAQLIAGFVANPTSGDAPLTVVFTDQSLPFPTSHDWDFENDGVIDHHFPNPTHIYDTPGVYDVKLIVRNGTQVDSILLDNYITVNGTGNNDKVNSFRTELCGNSPNPFNPSTMINFSLSETKNVKIDILNIKGQYIRTICNRNYEAGTNSVVWDGMDARGEDSGSGVYFIKMRTPDQIFIRKCTLIK